MMPQCKRVSAKLQSRQTVEASVLILHSLPPASAPSTHLVNDMIYVPNNQYLSMVRTDDTDVNMPLSTELSRKEETGLPCFVTGFLLRVNLPFLLQTYP